jgi:hypothetical protein
VIWWEIENIVHSTHVLLVLLLLVIFIVLLIAIFFSWRNIALTLKIGILILLRQFLTLYGFSEGVPEYIKSYIDLGNKFISVKSSLMLVTLFFARVKTAALDSFLPSKKSILIYSALILGPLFCFSPSPILLFTFFCNLIPLNYNSHGVISVRLSSASSKKSSDNTFSRWLYAKVFGWLWEWESFLWS